LIDDSGNINQPDGTHHYIGDGNDLDIYHTGTYGGIDNNTGGFYIDTPSGSDIWFRIDSTLAMKILSNQDVEFSGGITVADNVTMSDASKQIWDSVPASTDTMSGDMSSETVDANSVGIGGLLVLSADSHFDNADANAEATVGQLCLAVEAGTGTKNVLWNGWATDSGWTWTVGGGSGQLYASETTGLMTQTPPSTTGAFVQVVGYAISATTIRFNPSPDYLELV